MNRHVGSHIGYIIIQKTHVLGNIKKGTYVISLEVCQEIELLRNEHIRVCQSRLGGAGLHEDVFLSKISSSQMLSISKRGSRRIHKLGIYLTHILCTSRAGTG